jgi:hypothetical protein
VRRLEQGQNSTVYLRGNHASGARNLVTVRILLPKTKARHAGALFVVEKKFMEKN